jgi:AcrR family transcriptional regulator
VDRRQAILSAATKLFAEKGFACTPTSEIAKCAGVAEGTIFHHFKCKDEILLTLFKALVEQYVTKLRERVKESEDGLDGVERVICFHFEFMEKRSQEYLIVIRDLPYHLLQPDSPHRRELAFSQAQVVSLLKECIARGKKDGSIRENVPEEETAYFIRGLLHGISRQKFLGLMKIPDLRDEVIKFCRRSLGRF